MTKAQSWTLVSCAVLLTVCGIGGWFSAISHLNSFLDVSKSAVPDLKPTLEAISGPRGTLHEANKAIVAVKDAVITTQIQTRAITPHTIAAVDSLATIAPHANGAVDSVAKMANAATGTATAATDTLQTANSSIASLQPLIGHADASVQDFDRLITSKDIAEALHHTSEVTLSAQEIAEDARRVSDEATRRFFQPVPWYKKALPWITTGAKISAYALPWP